MMRFDKILPVAAISIAGILSGGADTAFAKGDNSDITEALDLPVGKTSYYFNRATNTAFIEKCAVNVDAVTCNLRILSNAAQLDYRQTDTYRDAGAGKITVSSSLLGSRAWSPDTFSDDYTAARNKASHYEWNKNFPIARMAGANSTKIIQNDILEITSKDESHVRGCSIVPVTENRGLHVCMEFNAGAGTVQVSTIPFTHMSGTATVADNQKASRPFDYNYDMGRFDTLKNKVTGPGPAYVVRN